MARKPRKPTVINAPTDEAIWQLFLSSISHHCPEVFQSLKDEVLGGTLSIQDWATRYHLQESRFQEIAKSTLKLLENDPQLQASFKCPISMVPRSAMEERAEWFELTVEIPAYWSVNRHWFDPEALKTFLRAEILLRLDSEIERFAKDMVERSGSRRATFSPKDLRQKLDCAALYLCRGMSVQEVQDHLKINVDRSRVYRWIVEILDLLGLQSKQIHLPGLLRGTRPKMER